jgi:Uma2 family endonuclease
VSTQPSSTIKTAEELLRLPDNGFRYELVDGELRQMTPSSYAHGVIVGNLTVLLGAFVRTRQLGHICGAETGFRIRRTPDTVRAPDIAFILQARRGVVPLAEGFYEGAPDLAVEVLSPSDTVFEVEEKVAQWLRAGCTAVWVVNSKLRSVTVHRPTGPPGILAETDTLDGDELLPGFTIPVADIFRW